MDYEKVYGDLFSNDYNKYGGNERSLSYTADIIKKNQIKTMVDVGSGTGSVIKVVNDLDPSINVTSCDLDKFHDLDCEFVKINLSNPTTYSSITDRKFDLLTCLDVLEHLEKDYMETVMAFFAKISEQCVLTIANHSDIQNGIELHTIIEDMTYWGPVVEKYFEILDTETHEYPQTNGNINYLYVLSVKSKYKL